MWEIQGPRAGGRTKGRGLGYGVCLEQRQMPCGKQAREFGPDTQKIERHRYMIYPGWVIIDLGLLTGALF